MTAPKPNLVVVNSNEEYPVLGHTVLHDGDDESPWYNDGIYKATDLEVERLARLAALEARVRGLYLRLLGRIQDRGRVYVHKNDDGHYAVVQAPDQAYGRDPLGNGCTCAKRGCEDDNCAGRCGCVLHVLEAAHERRLQPVVCVCGHGEGDHGGLGCLAYDGLDACECLRFRPATPLEV